MAFQAVRPMGNSFGGNSFGAQPMLPPLSPLSTTGPASVLQHDGGQGPGSADQGFISAYGEKLLRWGGRSVGCYAIDRGLKELTQNTGFVKTIQQAQTGESYYARLAQNAQNCKTYGHLLGLDNHRIGYGELLEAGGWQKFKEAVQKNYQNVKLPENFSIKDYFKQTVGSYNLGYFIDPIKDGALSLGRLANGAVLLMAGWKVLTTTKQAYDNAKAQEDGSMGSKVNTWAQTTWTFVTKTAKSAICWELETLGFMLASPLFAVGVVPGIVGGVAAGSLLSLGAFWLMDALVPDPKGPDPKASEVNTQKSENQAPEKQTNKKAETKPDPSQSEKTPPGKSNTPATPVAQSPATAENKSPPLPDKNRQTSVPAPA